MSKVPAAGVILSNDYESIRSAFKKGGSTSIGEAIGKNKNIFHFSNTNNSNLLSFRGSWGVNARTRGFTIELIDPTKDFEDTFLKMNLPSDLVNKFFSFKGYQLPTTSTLPALKPRVNKSFTKGQRAAVNEIIADLRNLSRLQNRISNSSGDNINYRIGLLDEASKEFSYSRVRVIGFDPITGKTSMEGNVMKGGITIGKKVYHPVYSDILTSFEKAIKSDEAFKKRILEQDETTKADVLKLNSSITRDNESIRKINSLTKEELSQNAIQKFLKAGVSNNTFYIAFGLGDDLRTWGGPFAVILVGADMSITDDKLRIITLKFLYTNGVMTVDSSEKPLYLDLNGFGVVARGRSDLVTLDLKLLKEDIQKFAIGRMGILTKNKGSIKPLMKHIDFHTIITQCIRRYLQSCLSTSNVIVLLPDINHANHRQHTELYQSIITRVFKSNSQDKFVAAIEMFSQSVLSKYGIRTEQDKDSVSNTLSPIHIKNIEVVNRAGLPFRGVMTSDYREHSQQFWHEGKKEYVKNDMPNFRDPLKKAISQITFGNNAVDLDTEYWEGNLDIAKIWNQYLPEAVPDPTKPVVLFGSRQLIKSFLYGVDSKSKTTDEEFKLHPNDSKLFLNKTMYKALNKVIIGDNKELLKSPFGDFFNADENVFTDELSINQTKRLLTAVDEKLLPVFRMGIKNPNVLDLNISYDKTYLAALRMGFEEAVQYYPILSDKNVKDIEKNYSLNHDWYKIIKSMRTREISEAEALVSFTKALGTKLASSTKLTEFITFIYSLNVLDPTSPKIPIYNESGVNPMSVQAHVLQRVIPKSVSLEIRTLPLFTLSTNYWLSHQCLLLGHSPQIVNSAIGSDIKKGKSDTFYSGMYHIFGWEHEISRNYVGSTFNLVMDMTAFKDSTLNIEEGATDNVGDSSVE